MSFPSRNHFNLDFAVCDSAITSRPFCFQEILTLLDTSDDYAQHDGAVLVFMPGFAHIQDLYDLLATDKRFSDKRRSVRYLIHS